MGINIYIAWLPLLPRLPHLSTAAPAWTWLIALFYSLPLLFHSLTSASHPVLQLEPREISCTKRGFSFHCRNSYYKTQGTGAFQSLPLSYTNRNTKVSVTAFLSQSWVVSIWGGPEEQFIQGHPDKQSGRPGT